MIKEKDIVEDFTMLRASKRFFATILVMILFSLSGATFAGPSSATETDVVVSGRPLKHIGSGLREYLLLDIYTLEAYSESGVCTPSGIADASEANLIRLTMSRDVPLGYLWWQTREAFKQNMPQSGDISVLQKKIKSFLRFFQTDLTEGASIEITYIPGKGCSVTLNGRSLGDPIPGKDFHELVWRSVFNGSFCCEAIVAQSN